MLSPKEDKKLKMSSGKSEDTVESPRTRFRVIGHEMLAKLVAKSGTSGRVYLPPNWVGKHVKIIRID